MYFSIFIFRFSKLNLVGIIIDRFRYQILLIIHKKWPNIHFCAFFDNEPFVKYKTHIGRVWS